jgi:hypothetical protein
MKTSSPRRSVSVAMFPAVPLMIARSALFGVARANRKQMLQGHTIAAADPLGVSLLYSGPQLSQYHALLWQAIIQAATRAKVADDQMFSVSADALLRAMGGQGNDTKQRGRLWGWLKDLTAARVELTTKTQGYVGPLVFEVARDTISKQVAVRLNPKLMRLLDSEVLRNDLARKAALGRNMLALWLHDYIATHLRPPPVAVVDLRDLCGSPLELPQFRQRLRAAMDLLAKGDDPLVLSWSLDQSDRLIVKKQSTRVIVLPAEVARAKQLGIQHQDRKWDGIQKARAQRARVAL